MASSCGRRRSRSSRRGLTTSAADDDAGSAATAAAESGCSEQASTTASRLGVGCSGIWAMADERMRKTSTGNFFLNERRQEGRDL